MLKVLNCCCLLFIFSINITAQITKLDALPNNSWSIQDAPKEFSRKLQLSFVSSNVGGFPSYGSVLAGGTHSVADGAAFQMYFPYSPSYGGSAPKIRLGIYNNVGWSEWETFYTSANANISTVDWNTRQLFVSGKSYFESPMRVTTNTDAVLSFSNTDNSWQYMQFIQSGNRKVWLGLDSVNNFNVVKEGGGDILFRGANVGIGTTSPDALLSVNGNIHTKEVKVDLIGWSDFVFENEYNLPTLEDVEKHIKDKGHLKDIPSAEEVAENGILLGEMDSKLLQKIEELMLYTIDQNKRIESLEKQVQELKKS